MPYRWVLCPVVIVGRARVPKVSTIADPGRPGKVYNHTSVISAGIGRAGENDAIALSLVRFVDPSALDADPEIESLSDVDDSEIVDVQREFPRRQAMLNAKARLVKANPGDISRLRC